MTATLTEARNEMHQAFQDVWDADSPSLNGGVAPPISYDAVAFDTPTAATWARIRIRHEQGEQATLGFGFGRFFGGPICFGMIKPPLRH